jgi:CubicO group peptidase (beta-lactamase class C family)
MLFFDSQVMLQIEQVVDRQVQPLVQAQQFSGVLFFARNGKVLLRKGYGMANYAHNIPTTPETKYHLCSVSKQFVALAVLQLHKQGKIKLQDSVAYYLPAYVHDKRITIEQLLVHTAGIPNYTGSAEFKQKYMRLALDLPKLIDLFKHKPLEFVPGTQYSYGNSGYVLLAALIEAVSGQSYVDYMQINILNKLAMHNSGCVRQPTIVASMASGYQLNNGHLENAAPIDMLTVIGAGDLYATVDDLYRWDREGLSKKTFEPELVKLMTTPVVHGANFFENPCSGYGLFIATVLGKKCFGRFGRLSGFHTVFLHFDEDDACLIILSNFEHSPIEEMVNQLLPLLMT